MIDKRNLTASCRKPSISNFLPSFLSFSLRHPRIPKKMDTIQPTDQPGKPLAIDLSHHLSLLATSRVPSPLKVSAHRMLFTILLELT